MMKKKLYLGFVLAWVFTACQTDKLEIVFADNTYQFTGVAVSQEGRIFVNYPYWQAEKKYALVEVLQNGEAIPYPDASWNDWQFGMDTKDKWVCVQAVYVDEKNILWVVDPAAPFLDKVVDKSYKLVAFDLAKNQVLEEYNLQGIVSENGYINDVRIDYRKNLAYLTNSNTGGIVVINLKDTSVSVNGNDIFFAKGETREFLKGTNFVLSDSTYQFKPNKGDILRNGENKAVRVQSDGITLSADGKTLFFKPLTDDKLYSIPTDLLGLEEFETCDEFKVSQVKDWGHISTSDGMATDAQGNIYLGDLENNAIVVFNPDTQIKKVLVQDERLQWADSFAIHDDYLYVACSQIHHLPGFNQGKSTRTTPYQLFKIKLKS